MPRRLVHVEVFSKNEKTYKSRTYQVGQEYATELEDEDGSTHGCGTFTDLNAAAEAGSITAAGLSTREEESSDPLIKYRGLPNTHLLATVDRSTGICQVVLASRKGFEGTGVFGDSLEELKKLISKEAKC